MTYATIYWYRSLICDAAIQAARRIAAGHHQSVVVEDRGTKQCYRITPSGRRWRAPRGWQPVWETGD